MRLADTLRSRLATVRPPAWLGPFGREPWIVLGPLILFQWLALLALALTVRHNSWLYYQGGDQTYIHTDAWSFAHWRLPTAEIGWGWSYVLTPIAAVAGANVLSGLPAVVLLNTIVLLPVALLSVYGIGARIAGRLFGYWTAAIWIAVPYLAIPLFVERYHGKYVEQTLPQTFGMTPLADFPSMVLLLLGAYLVLRSLDSGDWREPVLAGLVLGFALCVKPSNAIFLGPAALAFLLARRWRQLGYSAAALLPALLLVALWKQRGLGHQPLFGAPAGSDHLAALGLPVAPGWLASIGDFFHVSRYVHVNWDQLRENRDALREFFWAVRPLEWVPIAGLLALGRRSWPKAALVTTWFLAFLLIKGASDQARVEDASFWRLMMPSFPAFVFLLAAVPLLVPKLAPAVAARFPPAPARDPRRLTRVIAVCAVLVVLVPLVVIAATHVQVGPITVKNDSEHTSIPVSGAFHLQAHSTGEGVRLSWTAPYSGSVDVFYAVLRSRPSFPDPSNPEKRMVEEGVVCRPRTGGSAQDCHLYMPRVASIGMTSYVDHPPPGRWSYRIALGANWIRRASGGDLLLVSPPVTLDTR